MTQPPDYQHQQREEADPATTAALGERLDQPGEDTGSWTVRSADRRATTSVTSVTAPGHPPKLHPGAAAALLKLLRHVNDRRTNNPSQETS